MDINFPNLVAPKPTAMGTVSFQGKVDGDFIWCEISFEALRDCFGALSMSANHLLQAFRNGQVRIEHVARRNLEACDGHPILLRAVDF